MLQADALTLTTAVRTGWLIGLTPIWSALLAAVFLREGFGPRKMLGLFLGAAGAVVVISRGEFSSQVLALPATRGDLLILVSTVTWAIYTVLGRPTLQRLGSGRATTGAMFAGWTMLIPFVVSGAGWKEYQHLSSATLTAIIFLGVGCSGLGYLFWYAALERIDASQVACVSLHRTAGHSPGCRGTAWRISCPIDHCWWHYGIDRRVDGADGKVSGERRTRGSMMSLKNKVALVTGGTSGIGRAAAAAFAGAGGNIVLPGRRGELGRQVSQEL